MGILGPLGTDHTALARRTVYWLALMLIGTAFSNLVTRFAVRVELFEQRPWTWAVLVALAITPPLSVAVWLMTAWVFQVPMPPRAMLANAPPVLLISMAMLALTVLSQRRPALTHSAPIGSPTIAFHSRLPPRLRDAEIHAIQAEDHYLRLHTSAGQDLILMRLSDAIGELEGLEGARVHRSWWVARQAVIGAATSDGRASLSLKGGLNAPVSRTYVRSLRDEGWF